MLPGEKISVVNNLLHSLWSQVDFFLQGKPLSGSSGATYGYKAYFNTLLRFSDESKNTQLRSQMYFKDDPGVAMEDNDPIDRK